MDQLAWLMIVSSRSVLVVCFDSDMLYKHTKVIDHIPSLMDEVVAVRIMIV